MEVREPAEAAKPLLQQQPVMKWRGIDAAGM